MVANCKVLYFMKDRFIEHFFSRNLQPFILHTLYPLPSKFTNKWEGFRSLFCQYFYQSNLKYFSESLLWQSECRVWRCWRDRSCWRTTPPARSSRSLYPGYPDRWEVETESIEWFIEDQAFTASYIWLLPHPPPPHVSKLDRRHKVRLRQRDKLLKGERGMGWEGAQSFDGEKAWPSVICNCLWV